MEKRVVIAIILCVGVLAVWAKLNPPPPPPAPSAPTPAAAPAPSAAAPAPSAAAPAPSAPSPAAADQPEREIELPTKDVRFVFSTMGGVIKHAQLQDPTYRARKDDPATGHDLVTTHEVAKAAFRTTFPGATFPAPGASWQVGQQTADTVSFVSENADVRIEKRYHVEGPRYRMRLDVVVQNKTDKAQDHALTIAIGGRQDPEKKGGGFFSGGAANLSSALCSVNDEVKREPIEKLAKDPIEKAGTVRWIGTDEKFFLLAAVPYPENPPQQRICRGRTWDGGSTGDADVTFTSRNLAARASTTYSFELFAGPKFVSDLSEVRPDGAEVELEGAVDTAKGPLGIFGLLSKPILFLLKFFHGYVHNWGVAIILLTLFIKLLTFYPTQRSLLSAKKMQKLAPKMNAIRKKYENDRQRQSVETMNLYKAHGVSPFGGCLPSLIQMPIWIALYSTLNYAVELYRAPFIFHIRDLTDKDPFYITPLLMGGVMFLQMRMSPASPDNQQQQTMQVMMPIMFTAFSLVLPSGLALYMLTSYLIGILQQLYVNYVDRKGGAAA
jgi:YidC/Oxa1 family membrane protein insertase